MSERLTLVLGFGQPERGDAATGLLVAQAVQNMPLGHDPLVVVLGHDGDGDSLLNLLRSFERVILVSGVIASSGAAHYEPGTIIALENNKVCFPPPVEWPSPRHGLSIGSALGLAYSVGAWPDRLALYAVVGEHWHDHSAPSDAVQQAIAPLAEQISELALNWLGHDDTEITAEVYPDGFPTDDGDDCPAEFQVR